MTYLEFFRSVVTAGLICGLDNPIEWAVNAHRGGSLTNDFVEVNRHMPEFLFDMFEVACLRNPKYAQEVLDFVNSRYPSQHLAHGYFDFLKPQIQAYIESKNSKSAKHVDPYSNG